MSASPLSRLGLSSAAGDEADPSSGSRKTVLGVAVLGAVGVVLCAWLLLGGGDDLDDLGAVPAAAAVPPVAASAAPTPSPSVQFPDAEQVQDGRDPFAALYTETAPGAAATAAPALPAAGAPAPGDETAGGLPDSGGLPATGGTPATGGQPATGGTPRGSAPDAPVAGPAAAVALALLRTEGTDAARTAVFTVDGAEQAVAVGESFGPDGGLLLLSVQQDPDRGGWTAVVQQGSGDPFDVVTGVPVSLRA